MNRYLFMFDFDQTMAQTFTPNKDGIGVHQAYQQAVTDIFGKEGAKIYNETGGLLNQSSLEVIQRVLSNGRRSTLLDHGMSFVQAHADELTTLTPEGKGLSLQMNGLPVDRILGEALTRQKLAILLPLVSRVGTYMWPEPTKGFINFWQRLRDNRSGDMPVETAIVSAGHDAFIGKTLDMWGITKPDYMVTDDDIRAMQVSNGPALRTSLLTKPGPVPLLKVYQQWKSKEEIPANHVFFPAIDRQRMVFFGDDIKKDGQLARSALIPFGHYSPEGAIQREGHTFSFNDWRDIGDLIEVKRDILREDTALSEVFLAGSREGRVVNNNEAYSLPVERR